jgi:hypothetical protein
MGSLALTEVKRKNNFTPKKVEILCLIQNRNTFDTFIQHKTENSSTTANRLFSLTAADVCIPANQTNSIALLNTNHPKKGGKFE